MATLSLPSLPMLPSSKPGDPQAALQNASLQPAAVDKDQVMHVENKYRAHVFAMRIRLVELFQDFDKLRSGLMTPSQFRRCVAASLDKGVGSSLTEPEINIMLDHYTDRKTGMVRWRLFVDSIDKVFGAKQLEKSPTSYGQEVVKPFRRPLSPNSEQNLQEIIGRLRSYVKHHGSDLKSWFKDFDKYNNGYVTYNQFRRGIPQNLLSMEEEDLLLTRYGEAVTSTINYFKMNTDVNRKAPRPIVDHSQLVAKPKPNVDWYNEHVPVGTEELLHYPNAQLGEAKNNIQAVEEKIKKYVYKNRMRLIEFFRDYDRHNWGLVTEPQFRAGVCLAALPLESFETNVLVQHYQDYSGRVNYRRFCTSIDTVFTVNHLERDPLYNVKPPSRDWLLQGSNELVPAEEIRCTEIIAHLRGVMKQRRLLLAPFFKDFDKHLGNMGRVTRSHFSRLLSTNNLHVSDDDLHILFRKYEDRSQGKVNYMEFIRTIDPDTYIAYNNALRDEKKALEQQEKQQQTMRAQTAAKGSRGRQHSIENILTRIRNHVGTKRIRISEFFKDFDKLRSYSIRSEEFIRGLGYVGVDLSESDRDVLAEHYRDDRKKGCCRWKDFEQDIEKIFGETHLESRPTYVHSTNTERKSPFVLAKKPLTPHESALLARTLNSICEHLRIRQCSVKPFFRDFDKVCTGTGHITKSQFRQCLTYMKIDVTDEEFEVLCKCWTKSETGVEESRSRPSPTGGGGEDEDDQGRKDYIKDVSQNINYILFLEELESRMSEDHHQDHYGAAGSAGSAGSAGVGSDASSPGKPATSPGPKPVLKKPAEPVVDTEEFEKLMMRIKIKAKTERIRVIDFMADFDNLKHGKITKNEFRRAIKVLYADLTEADLRLLEHMFQSTQDPRFVNYVKFSDDVESVFTKKGLVKSPMSEPEPFNVYSNGWEADPSVNVLSPDERVILDKVLARLQQRVSERRIDVLSYMEDYDFVQEGTITSNQFRSVLNSMNLGVTDQEMRVLSKFLGTNTTLSRLNYRKLGQPAL
ncbi:hypothetical protein BC831DRAFT_187984 [Entophlyctis helioformis]|nr:hypothetical protein BC831DRAFT_187984 [Entophlyctis helioformis]